MTGFFFQGAGGNGNVLKEIVEPAGGKFEVRNLLLGDKSLSVLEIWGAEYQENDALLLPDSAEALDLFDKICKREVHFLLISSSFSNFFSFLFFPFYSILYYRELCIP